MLPLILIVEDERDLVSTLEYNLQKEGFQTLCAFTGREGIDLANRVPYPDLVLLDLMLPDISGFDVCRFLKSNENTRNIPVIMATAKGDEIDRVVGFELGADDYVVKPFSVRELTLRIKAVLRRAKSGGEATGQKVFGKIRIDSPGHRLWVDEIEINLTALEFRLLATLYARRGRVQSRGLLLGDVWGDSSDVTSRTVDTHIKRLREKLGSAAQYIETVRGVGYRFRREPNEDGN